MAVPGIAKAAKALSSKRKERVGLRQRLRAALRRAGGLPKPRNRPEVRVLRQRGQPVVLKKGQELEDGRVVGKRAIVPENWEQLNKIGREIGHNPKLFKPKDANGKPVKKKP